MAAIAEIDMLNKNQIGTQYGVIPQINHWRYRRINVYGDERCTGWVDLLVDYLDLESIINYSVDGTHFVDASDTYQLNDQITASSSKPIDAALVLCGYQDHVTNQNRGTPLTLSSTALSTDETEVTGGINAAITAFIAKFGPAIPLIFITGFPNKYRATANTGAVTPFTMFGLDRVITDYAHKYYHYPTIRADDCGIDFTEGAAHLQDTIYSSDNISLNTLGDERFARFIAKRLGQIYLRGN
jgi:hypothetical protein